ncbi:hypothetical protein LCL85_15250 [Vibrio alginolyticus]|nr:hypothetical protein [Vibrio alginolyticus]
MEEIKSWLYSTDGAFIVVTSGIYLLGFFGLALVMFTHYLDKKEEKEEQFKRKRDNHNHSQQKSNSVHHV